MIIATGPGCVGGVFGMTVFLEVGAVSPSATTGWWAAVGGSVEATLSSFC